jgi:hypothetical protein
MIILDQVRSWYFLVSVRKAQEEPRVAKPQCREIQKVEPQDNALVFSPLVQKVYHLMVQPPDRLKGFTLQLINFLYEWGEH